MRRFSRELAYRSATALHPYLDGRMFGVSRRDHGDLGDMRVIAWLYHKLIGYYRYA